jgi:hypothetical protein
MTYKKDKMALEINSKLESYSLTLLITASTELCKVFVQYSAFHFLYEIILSDLELAFLMSIVLLYSGSCSSGNQSTVI